MGKRGVKIDFECMNCEHELDILFPYGSEIDEDEIDQEDSRLVKIECSNCSHIMSFRIIMRFWINEHSSVEEFDAWRERLGKRTYFPFNKKDDDPEWSKE